MIKETILRNAHIVTEDEIVHGSIVTRNGIIVDIATGPSSVGEDAEGDYIMPGFVELHTDHLEQHYAPRPGVVWNLTAAIQAHDAQIAASGITTVFDCLRLGSDYDGGYEKGEMRALSAAIADAQDDNRLRVEHLIHLRCEVSAPDVLEHFAEFDDDQSVRLISLMDHAPGQRQFQTMGQYTLYYKTKRGLTDEQFDAFVEHRKGQSALYSDKHRSFLSQACAKRGIAIASHDDATLDHVEDAKRIGVSVAEFPTSLAAAVASHEAGMGVLMGAPNVVRGMSHSGNIAARDLAKANVLDILSSDYVPFSLMLAPFILADEVDDLTLPQAVKMVSANPAKQVGLTDRGRLKIGLRADFSRVMRPEKQVPIIRSVWRGGQRII